MRARLPVEWIDQGGSERGFHASTRGL